MSIDWKYDLREAITETIGDSQESQFVFNIEIIDHHLQLLTHHSRDYGVHIADEDRTEVEAKLKQLIGVLDLMLESYPEEVDILMRSAYAHGISHQLSFDGSADKTIQIYKNIIEKDPSNPQANFLLGMFMFGSKEHSDECVPYLETALEGGIESCRFTLGMIYLKNGDIEKGKEFITTFSEANPDNQYAQLVVQALEKGELNLNQNDEDA